MYTCIYNIYVYTPTTTVNRQVLSCVFETVINWSMGLGPKVVSQ